MKRLLSSTAALKALYDNKGMDLYDSFSQFISYVIAKTGVSKFSSMNMQVWLEESFGIKIPLRSIELICGKMAKGKLLRRDNGEFVVDSIEFNVAEFEELRTTTAAETEAIISALIEYFKTKYELILDPEEIEVELLKFIDSNGADFLRHISGNGSYEISHHDNRIFYGIATWLFDPEIRTQLYSDQITRIFLGRIISNAIGGIDLIEREQKFKDTTVYLDTPFILDVLGIFDEYNKVASSELLQSLRSAKAKVSIYQHTFEEVRSIFESIENKIHRGQRIYGDLSEWLRREKITPSDLVFFKENLDQTIEQLGVSIVPTPPYSQKYQVDEDRIKTIMIEQNLLYSIEKGREYDINSIRSIYAQRGENIPRKIEESIAIFATPNSTLQRVAFYYSRHHESTKHIAAIVTTGFLTNYLWVKFPTSMCSAPQKMFLASCYSLTRPDSQFIDAFVHAVDKLKANGKINEKQYQIARWDVGVRAKVQSAALNDSAGVTEDKIQKILTEFQLEIASPIIEERDRERRERELQEAEVLRLSSEIETVKGSAQVLESTTTALMQSQRKTVDKISGILSWVISIALFAPITFLYFKIDEFKTTHTIIGWFIVSYFGLALLVNTLWGPALFAPFNWLRKKIHKMTYLKIVSILKIDIRE